MVRPRVGPARLRQWAERLKRESYALYLAIKDPRTPWYAKAIGACVVGYALSPIDLIPDFLPILGYLDDLLLVPAGLALARRMIPASVMEEMRDRAKEELAAEGPRHLVAAAIIVAIWVGFMALAAGLVLRALLRSGR